MMNFLTLVRVEWTKTMRMMSTYIAFVAAGMLVMLVQLGIFFTGDRSGEYEWLERNGFDTNLLINAYCSTRMAMEIGFVMLLAPMIIQVFARQVAGEDLRGTLRLILSRPVSRIALLNAKFVVCSAYCMLLMGFTISLSYGVGLVFYGPQNTLTIGSFRELDGRNYRDEFRKFQNGEKPANMSDEAFARLREKNDETKELMREGKLDLKGYERRMTSNLMGYTLSQYEITNGEGIKRMFYAWLLTSWALLTIGSIAMFYSTINKHPIAAMALTIGTYFMVLILQGLASQDNIMQLFKDLKPYLFTTAMDYYRGCMSIEIDWGKIRSDGGLLGAYTAAFFAIAQIIFWRKDITS